MNSRLQKNIDQRDLSLLMLLAEANNTHTGWQNFLDKLISHFDLNCCNLYLLNPISQGIRFQEWSGQKPSDIQLNDYIMNYFHSDTTHSLMFSGQSGTWLTPNLRPDQEELESTAAYQKWAIPNNFIYSTATTLFKEPDAICAIHFSRGKEHPSFTQEEEDRFTAITPYIEKAIRLRLKLASSIENNLLLKSAVNAFKIPIAILNEFAEVVAINDLMETQLNNSKDLFKSENVLHAKDKETDFNLQFSVANAISEAKSTPLKYTPKDILLSIDNTTHKVGVCKIAEKGDIQSQQFIGAMVYLVPSKVEKNIQKKQLINIFKFTESEAEVCQLFIENKSVNLIAKLRNKSTHTVREQLQNCYIKTGVNNQIELINLIVSIPVT